MAAALVPAGIAWAAYPLAKPARSICNEHLRRFDGTDVFAQSPNEVLHMAKLLGLTELRLRQRFVHYSWPELRPVRLGLRKAAHLGRVYSRAYRRDPTDNSLPEEAAFENSLLDLRRTASRAGLRACSIRLATP